MGDLTIEYPTWAYFLCPVIGLLFAGILYYRNRNASEWTPSTRFVMAFLRFGLVTLIAFLLLGPLIRYLDVSIEPPVVAVVVDNSSSLILGPDSADRVEEMNRTLDQLRSELEVEYELATYTFGDGLNEQGTPDFTSPVTDISEALSSLKIRYANRNLGAVVLLSDGIYNRGSNPIYTAEGLKAPVYTVALGDTTLRRDARIAEAAANRVAFLGNSFPIEVRVEAYRLDGRSAVLTISRRGEALYSQNVEFDGSYHSETFRALLKADKPGLSRFDIALSVVDGESNESNNYRSVYIDIIDDRRRVLVLGNSPHPDLKAIRESIGSNINYEVEVDLASSWKGDFAEYDLVVLHQLPSGTSSGQNIRRLAKASDVPLFVIVGRQTALSTLGELGLGVSFSGRANTTDDVSGKVNPNFSLFQVPEELDDLVTEAPPLQIPFGEWKRANSSEVLLYRKVGRIATEEPLLLFNPLRSKKRGILLGEGLWRWRLTDYAMNEDHVRFDDFFTNVVQYLAVKEDKRLFRTEGPGRVRENESLIFRAELYTPAYQPVNDAEVQLIVTDEDGRTYPFNFSRSGTGYRLNAGILPPGNYRYEAFTERGGQRLSDQGSFAVTSFDLESARLRADHELLYTLSDRTGGTLVYPSNVDEISQTLLRDETAPKPVSYNTEVFTSLLNFRWIFFVLLILLSAEWFMRKYLGKY